MMCACGHAVDYDNGDGVRKIRTKLLLIKRNPLDGNEQLHVMCPECRAEIPIHVGAAAPPPIPRRPVLHVKSLLTPTTSGA